MGTIPLFNPLFHGLLSLDCRRFFSFFLFEIMCTCQNIDDGSMVGHSCTELQNFIFCSESKPSPILWLCKKSKIQNRSFCWLVTNTNFVAKIPPKRNRFFTIANYLFNKVNLFFLKSRVVRFKKDWCSESKNWSSGKMSYVGEFASWYLS